MAQLNKGLVDCIQARGIQKSGKSHYEGDSVKGDRFSPAGQPAADGRGPGERALDEHVCTDKSLMDDLSVLHS